MEAVIREEKGGETCGAECGRGVALSGHRRTSSRVHSSECGCCRRQVNGCYTAQIHLPRVFPSKTEAGFLLPEAELVLPGADAAKMLEQCDQAVLMACTLGTQFEALLRGEQARDMSRAVILAACGSAWVEAGCDQVEQELAHCLPNRYRTDRFSPGTGDPAVVFAAEDLRRTGYPKAAWTVCNRELFDEPIQVSHRHHRLVRLAPDGPHPWMHILFDA